MLIWVVARIRPDAAECVAPNFRNFASLCGNEVVADRLDAKVYIAKVAIGWTGMKVLDGCDLGTVVKWIGYVGGPLALDYAVTVLLPSLTGWCPVHADAELAVAIRGLAASLMMPVRHQKDVTKLLRLQARLLDITRVEGANQNQSMADVFSEIVGKTVENLPQKSIQPPPKSNDESPEEPSVDPAAGGIAVGNGADLQSAAG